MPQKKRKRRDLGRQISIQNAIAAIAHLENTSEGVSATLPGTAHHPEGQANGEGDQEEDSLFHPTSTNAEGEGSSLTLPEMDSSSMTNILDNQSTFSTDNNTDDSQDSSDMEHDDEEAILDEDVNSNTVPIERDNHIHIDQHEEAMLELLKLCQDGGTSLE